MIDYQKLKQLRADTKVSFSLCKKALEEMDNDMEKAKAKLKEWGIKKAEGKSDREIKAGGIYSYVHHNHLVAAMLELGCETDFVSGNDDFKKLGSELAMQVASVPAKDVEELLKQDYIREAGKTVDDMIKEAILKFGENIRIARFQRWELGE
ncbi:elongation factor Ts [Candidatus Roizmanbacteria bacterium]|nr:MAG: elongation factor Ts [Candidatus Roizmanbacteria bacterium]